ncbi:MAG: Gfo/Idh/MocA family protein [Christensenellales bacterium]|jgi:UDP-N-acetyl-2-amino-2-deoxyglucuronate dehydrogenase
MSAKIKTAVLGCGKVGHFHAHAFQTLKDSEFSGVWSRNFERAEGFGAQYGVPAFRTIEELAQKTGANAAAICTTHLSHAKVAVEAARCGMHLFIEKPLAISLEDCDAILEAADKYGVKVGVTCQRRCFPASQRVKQAIDQGKIGQPMLGQIQMLGWRDKAYYDSDGWRGTWDGEGGGVLVNQAPHQLDLLQWYMGEIDEVFGTWANLNHPYIEVDDTAIAVVKFKNGALANIIVTNSVNPALYGKVHIYGSSGAGVGVQTDGGQMFIAGVSAVSEPAYNDLWTVPGEEQLAEQWKQEDTEFFASIDATRHFHVMLAEDFLKAIINDTQPLVTGIDGRRTVELFQAIYLSEKLKKVIKLPL